MLTLIKAMGLMIIMKTIITMVMRTTLLIAVLSSACDNDYGDGDDGDGVSSACDGNYGDGDDGDGVDGDDDDDDGDDDDEVYRRGLSW